MNIKEINGVAIKKALGAKRCSFRYHNKNKSGGNFGFEIRGLPQGEFELNGDYRADGTISHLAFGRVYWTCKGYNFCTAGQEPLSFHTVIELIKSTLISMETVQL